MLFIKRRKVVTSEALMNSNQCLIVQAYFRHHNDNAMTFMSPSLCFASARISLCNRLALDQLDRPVHSRIRHSSEDIADNDGSERRSPFVAFSCITDTHHWSKHISHGAENAGAHTAGVEPGFSFSRMSESRVAKY